MLHYPYPWYNPAFPQSIVSMAFLFLFTTMVPIPMALPLMSMAQLSVPTTIQLLASYTPQVYPTAAPVAPFAPVAHVVPIKYAWFDKLKATMDMQATLIAALITHNDKEPTEATKCLCPLADEVDTEDLPEKYKCPTFTKFNGNDNPSDHIIIFEI